MFNNLSKEGSVAALFFYFKKISTLRKNYSYEKSHKKSCTHCLESRDMLKKEIDYYLDVLGEDLHNILSAYIDNNLSKFIESLSNSEYKKYMY